MSTLYLDRRELSLKLEGRALAVFADDKRTGTVPLHVLERVVMRSSVRLDSSLLARLADAGVGVVAYGGRNGSKVAQVSGRGHNDGARRVGQYLRYGDVAWRQRWGRLLVGGKLRGQSRVLQEALAERADQRRVLTTAKERIDEARSRVLGDKALTLGSLRGIEGAAAAAYFAGFVRLFPESLDFTGRNRRPPRDPVNAVLSLSYTMLHYDAVRACHCAGLDPIIGYLHELDYGRESLASDLIEPLRPRIDAWVWQQFRDRTLRDEHFSRDGEACLLGKTGRQHFYREFEVCARPLRRLLRRFASKLAVAMGDAGHNAAGDKVNDH